MSFIVIEGVDGSGKATQTALLKKKLTSQGKKIDTISFPQYESPSSYFVKRFLNGEYGTFDKVNERLASMFYVLDRFDYKPKISKKIQENDFLISDRYSISSFIHRGVKYLQENDEKGLYQFFDRLKQWEFEYAGLPVPDIIIFLSLSLENQKILLEKKAKENREYTKEVLDIAESDMQHQKLALTIGIEVLPKYFDNYYIVNCDDKKGGMLMPEQINIKIQEIILS